MLFRSDRFENITERTIPFVAHHEERARRYYGLYLRETFVSAHYYLVTTTFEVVPHQAESTIERDARIHRIGAMQYVERAYPEVVGVGGHTRVDTQHGRQSAEQFYLRIIRV